MRDRILDLIFLIGVVFKGIDGVAELISGAALLIVTPTELVHAARLLTLEELSEDPRDILANLLLHEVAHLDSGTTTFLSLYLLLHGIVKLAIVAALLFGSRRIYPWAIAALGAFLVFQIYEMIAHPGLGVALLTVFDAFIIWLTWREWRHGRTLHETWHGTLRWLRRPAAGNR